MNESLDLLYKLRVCHCCDLPTIKNIQNMEFFQDNN